MRKNLLIKPRLQLMHLAWVSVVVLLTSLSGYILLEFYLSKYLTPDMLRSQEWVVLLGHLRWGFLVVVLILLAGIGIETYFYFHRFVGPLYALEKGFKRLANGNFQEAVRIRDGDMLEDLVHEFEQVKKVLQARNEANEKALLMLSKELTQVLSNVTTENLDQLQTLLKKIKKQMEKKAA